MTRSRSRPTIVEPAAPDLPAEVTALGVSAWLVARLGRAARVCNLIGKLARQRKLDGRRGETRLQSLLVSDHSSVQIVGAH